MTSRRYAIALINMSAGLSLLLAGGLLYVLYRPQTLLLFHLASAIGLDGSIAQWREEAAAFQPTQFVVYNMPAGLWAASYVLITATLSTPLSWPKRYIAVAFIPLAGATSELMQAVHLLPGTFDGTDLALYLTPLAAFAIYSKTSNNK